MCHMSGVRGQVSGVMCHVSILVFVCKVVELVGGGSAILFLKNLLLPTRLELKLEHTVFPSKYILTLKQLQNHYCVEDIC